MISYVEHQRNLDNVATKPTPTPLHFPGNQDQLSRGISKEMLSQIDNSNPLSITKHEQHGMRTDTPGLLIIIL